MVMSAASSLSLSSSGVALVARHIRDLHSAVRRAALSALLCSCAVGGRRQAAAQGCCRQLRVTPVGHGRPHGAVLERDPPAAYEVVYEQVGVVQVGVGGGARIAARLLPPQALEYPEAAVYQVVRHYDLRSKVTVRWSGGCGAGRGAGAAGQRSPGEPHAGGPAAGRPAGLGPGGSPWVAAPGALGTR